MGKRPNFSEERWLKAFRHKLSVNRVPASGMIELTNRCGLHCVHCYLGPSERRQTQRHRELTTEQLTTIIDEVVGAGCLSLVLTGGDPLVREDFEAIYRHTVSRGVLVTVFTNGLYVSEAIADLMAELPPLAVEISLYGASDSVYEKVTGVSGGFERCLRGVERLVDRGVRVKLKTVAMTLNQHEIPAMRRHATELGLPFRIDAAVFSCLDGSGRENQELRIEPSHAIALEMADGDRLQKWRRKHEQESELPVAENLYVCGAGVTTFHVDPYGNLSPCLMTGRYRHSLLERGFSDLWQSELGRLRSQLPGENYRCNTCEIRFACSNCPAFNELETGHADEASPFVCEMAHLRFEAINGVKGRAKISRDGDVPVDACHNPGS